MKYSPLINKSKTFALNVIKVCKQLRTTKCEPVLINQFIRSGTSIGANIEKHFMLIVDLILLQNFKLL